MTNTHRIFRSVASFDLGAINTGIFLLNHGGDQPSCEHARALTISLPTGKNGFQLSNKNRTAVRHRVRSSKRFKLARRLLFVILNECFKEKGLDFYSNENSQLREALGGLLKRRGYTFLLSETPVDISKLESVDPAVFNKHELFSDIFDKENNFAEQWEEFTKHPEKLRSIVFPDEKEFEKWLKTEFGTDWGTSAKSLISLHTNALKIITKDAKSILDELAFGHRHRTQYLKELRDDIPKDTRLITAISVVEGVDRFWRLICNISNLQLRAERWYFNAPEMLLGDLFQPQKLKKSLVRAFKYFHPGNRQNALGVQKLINELERSSNIIDTLCSIDPVRTIPFYEDQNNRRPPLDLTLYLNPDALTKRYGATWTVWATRFLNREPALAENLDEILSITDRQSRLKSSPQYKNINRQAYFFSYVLQRVLDRNKARDVYKLRLISKNSQSQEAQVAISELASCIGSQHVQAFIEFARHYYTEISDARSSLWFEDNSDNLLERADIHPSAKKNILHTLVGSLFGQDANFGKNVIQKHWNRKISNSRSTLKSTCLVIEKTRKAFDNQFNQEFKQVVELVKSNQLSKPDQKQKQLLDVYHRVEAVRTDWETNLEGYDARMEHYACDPFVLSQLYNLIETDRAGFSSTSLAAHLENQWRMSNNDDLGAQCSRLPADSIKPFDGVLRKVLDKQAVVAARTIADNLMRAVGTQPSDICFTAIIEENKFNFSAGLTALKKGADNVDKSTTTSNSPDYKRWLNQKERLLQSSRALCAYTGEPLGEHIEIDHIVPQSLTRDISGTVFNSEPNLILVSQKGNQMKADHRYTLHHLHPTYLQAVFGTSNIQTITAKIERVASRLLEKKQKIVFHALSQDEQDCIRHALFLSDDSEIRSRLLRTLATANINRVNGTQAWFLRRVITRVLMYTEEWRKANLHNIRLKTTRVSSYDCSRIRKALAESNPVFEKPDDSEQPFVSHAIDAMCAFAVASGNRTICDFMGSDIQFANAKFLTTKGKEMPLQKLFPANCDLIRIQPELQSQTNKLQSRQIFKDTIYSESYLPILTFKDDVFLGFALPKASGEGGNAIRLIGKKPKQLLVDLADFLDRPYVPATHPVTYRIQPDKAHEFLVKAANKPESLTEQENKVLQLLIGLKFTTIKNTPQKVLSQNEKFVSKAAAEKIIDAKLAININSFGSKTKLGYSARGQLVLPTKHEWISLLNNQHMNALWSGTINDPKANFAMEEWLKSFIPSRLTLTLHGSCTKRLLT